MVEEGAICMIRVYLDVVLVIFVSTFVLELATLWATREVVGIKRRFVKMLMGAFSLRSLLWHSCFTRP